MSESSQAVSRTKALAMAATKSFSPVGLSCIPYFGKFLSKVFELSLAYKEELDYQSLI